MKKYESIVIKDKYEANIDCKVNKTIEEMENKGYRCIGINTSRVLNDKFKFDYWRAQVVFKIV